MYFKEHYTSVASLPPGEWHLPPIHQKKISEREKEGVLAQAVKNCRITYTTSRCQRGKNEKMDRKVLTTF